VALGITRSYCYESPKPTEFGSAHMSRTITVCLDGELADWLADTARGIGRSQGEIVREQLERARSEVSRMTGMLVAFKIAA
jgi:hypothetical protein